MEIFITGGTGFLGTVICQNLLSAGHQVTVLTRSAEKAAHMPKSIGKCIGDPMKIGPWQEEAARYQGFINLAGASIFGRWNNEYKELILKSRVTTTRNLVQAIEKSPTPEETVLISTSAVGYYGFHQNEILTELSLPGTDFLAQVCLYWENEAIAAQDAKVRVVMPRFGTVLGKNGGAMGQMLPFFNKGLGGPLGSGKQWFSWIHLDDLVRGILFLLKKENIKGPVNFCSPNPVTNKEFAKSLGKVLKRPAITPTPAFALKLAFGEFAKALLNGQRVIPQKLLDAGFEFEYPHVVEALEDVLKNGV